MIDIYDVVKRPIVSESSVERLEKSNTYVFEVHRDANKVQIRNAIQKLFSVTVTKVNTASKRGKPIRRGGNAGHRPTWKKAYVTLKGEDAIELY
jgi:large subunit ribosomal protein L23